MRIAVFHNLPPGGAKRAVFELMRITARVHDYDVFRIDLGAADRWPEQTGQDVTMFAQRVITHRLRGIRSTSHAWRVPTVEAVIRLQRAIARQIDEGHYDLAFVHHDQYLSSPSLLRWLKTPSVYYCQEARRRSFEHLARASARGRPADAAVAAYEAVLRRRDLAAARAADHVLCNSVFSAECIARGYGRSARVCRLGFDESVFHPGNAARTDVPGHVVSVGALDPAKGHDLVVRAVALVPEMVRPRLEVVYERGPDEYGRALERLAATSGVRLTLRRSVSDAELAARYASAVCTAAAAHAEPFGLTVLESLGCGTPVVAVEEGGYRETVVGGTNGFLVPRDARAFADAIGRVIAGALDPVAVRPPGGRRYWSWHAAGERLLAAFEDAVASSNTA